jgi:hypothetical protein
MYELRQVFEDSMEFKPRSRPKRNTKMKIWEDLEAGRDVESDNS